MADLELLIPLLSKIKSDKSSLNKLTTKIWFVLSLL